MYTFVEVLAAMLFLATRDSNDKGYYPSNGMVTAQSTAQCQQTHMHDDAQRKLLFTDGHVHLALYCLLKTHCQMEVSWQAES